MGFSDYRTALVTGASSGIGAATVRRLSAEGLEVYAVARDAARLSALSAETGCRPCAVDISNLDALAALAKSAEFDVLVNNAGQSRRGNIPDTAPDDVDTLVDVNLRAILHLTRLIAPGMAMRNCDHVINVSSIAGHYAFGENATTFNSSVAYHATKAGVHSLSQQLRVDLYGSRVRVTEVSESIRGRPTDRNDKWSKQCLN
jgi:NADP-dependent 3-hydroxy acid dehydrogenase YdfG